MVTRSQVVAVLQGMYGTRWELAIYRFYSGQDITPDSNIYSTVRDNDTAPSLRVFKNEEGSYLAYDYGRDETYNVFTFAHAYNDNKHKKHTIFSINAACECINEDMGLGISDDPFDIVIPNADFSLSDRDFKKSDPPEVCIYPNKFGGIDSRYWGEYFITEEWLSFFNAGVVYQYYFSYDKGFTWEHKYTYRQSNPCYYYQFIDRNGRAKIKLLKPYADDYKWWTNISKQDLNSIQGFAQADLTQKKVYLTSSLKDIIILRMLGYTAYALHGEAYKPSAEFLEHLYTHHEEVIVLMDNDEAGRKATAMLLSSDPIFTRGVFIPNGMFFSNGKEISDPSDFIKYTKGDFHALQTLIQ